MTTYWIKNKQIGYGKWNLYKIIVFLFGHKVVKYFDEETKYAGYDLYGYEIMIGLYHRKYFRNRFDFILSKIK